MHLFQHSSGTVIAFGFNMLVRAPAPQMICWNDPATGEWEAKVTNLAGDKVLAYDIKPEFVRECQDGVVCIYQPGRCTEMIFVGGPYVWSLRILQPLGAAH